MGCTFCATGRMGFHQDLTASEIADQVIAMNRLSLNTFSRPVTNVVYMGMGEPMLNFQAVLDSVSLLSDARVLGLSPKRITISTVGLAARIRNLADANLGVNLAISLHAPDDTKRSSIMPINRKAKTDLRALRQSVVYYHKMTGAPITYEYCMFDGFNDTDQDAAHLAAVTRWAPSKVNLIMYNQVDGTGFRRTHDERLNAFIALLVGKGVRVTVRRSRGQDIAAACGQLAVASAR
jgi:23S rRNA (adenine2503-C2)-methyltransferase